MSTTPTLSRSAPADYSPKHRGTPFRKWLIVTQYYPPEQGAAQIRLSALARELRKHGCSVEVLTAMPNYPFGKIEDGYRGRLFVREVGDDTPIERIWLYPATGRKPFRRMLSYLTFSAGATACIPRFRPDVVFIEAQPISLAFAGYLLKVLRGVPFIYNTPDLQVEVASGSKWIHSKVLLASAVLMERLLMKQALAVSTVTESFVQFFVEHRGIPRSRLTLLPNGADVEHLRPQSFDHEFARSLGVSGKTVFTYAGTHAPSHGLEVMLAVAERLQDRPDVVVLMVGNGPLREHLQQQAKQRNLSNLVFRDSPFSEMNRLMSISCAALGCIGTMQFASNMRLAKVIPPLACGRPVIYFGKGEWTNVLREKSCGLAIESGDAGEFADAIRTLADAPELCVAMGARGRRFVEAELSWSVIVERWLDQLGAVVRGENPWCAGHTAEE